jgi:hypothetical protein
MRQNLDVASPDAGHDRAETARQVECAERPPGYVMARHEDSPVVDVCPVEFETSFTTAAKFRLETIK